MFQLNLFDIVWRWLAQHGDLISLYLRSSSPWKSVRNRVLDNHLEKQMLPFTILIGYYRWWSQKYSDINLKTYVPSTIHNGQNPAPNVLMLTTRVNFPVFRCEKNNLTRLFGSEIHEPEATQPSSYHRWPFFKDLLKTSLSRTITTTKGHHLSMPWIQSWSYVETRRRWSLSCVSSKYEETIGNYCWWLKSG